MRSNFLLILAVVVSFEAVLLAVASAQTSVPVTPSQPTRFKKRDVGTGFRSTGSGVGIGPVAPKPAPAKPTLKTIQYIGVATERNYTNGEGKTIRGTLLAFENGPQEKVAGPLTLIRDEKVRLLRTGTNKPVVFLLSLLSPADQKFVRDLDATSKKAVRPELAKPK